MTRREYLNNLSDEELAFVIFKEFLLYFPSEEDEDKILHWLKGEYENGDLPHPYAFKAHSTLYNNDEFVGKILYNYVNQQKNNVYVIKYADDHKKHVPELALFDFLRNKEHRIEEP